MFFYLIYMSCRLHSTILFVILARRLIFNSYLVTFYSNLIAQDDNFFTHILLAYALTFILLFVSFIFNNY